MSSYRTKILARILLFGILAILPSAAQTAAVPVVIKKLTELYGTAKISHSPTEAADPDPLGTLLRAQQRHWSAAWVTSTFYDWRTTSKYRRKAGLHLGYDIALPFGTPVSAAWGGQVRSVTPWTASEYGVTIEHPNGVLTTYGHISPLVRPGRLVKPGQIIGRIASDHVDVKMRDRMGRPLPFGESPGLVSLSGSRRLPTDRNSLLTSWLVAKTSLDQAEEALFLSQNSQKKWELETRKAEGRIAFLKRTLSQVQGREHSGAFSRRELEEFKADLADAQQLLKQTKAKSTSTPAELEENVRQMRTDLEAISDWARAEGLNWSDVSGLISDVLSRDGKLRAQVSKQGSPSKNLEELEKETEAGRARLISLEELYAAGGLSLSQIEDRRLKQNLLEEELRIRRARLKR